MKRIIPHYVAKLLKYFRRKKVVEKTIEPIEPKVLIGIIKSTKEGKQIIFDFTSTEGKNLSLQQHLQRYYSCNDSVLKEQYLIDMYNDGFLDEAIHMYENKNGIISIDYSL
ncbi:hypothetical protein HX001_14270 [Empedobacter brevis]|uniref:Uncharacterized protein n=1 Tax=Empedobacter brevis TaxID=247 RepID=A0AAJ1QGI1_9FLAO|nr:hypothetical protein [Empedobacter brevis]MDM1073651.1 hypothetical protein [Empedobacter brevis]